MQVKAKRGFFNVDIKIDNLQQCLKISPEEIEIKSEDFSIFLKFSTVSRRKSIKFMLASSKENDVKCLNVEEYFYVQLKNHKNLLTTMTDVYFDEVKFYRQKTELFYSVVEDYIWEFRHLKLIMSKEENEIFKEAFLNSDFDSGE